MFANRAFTRVTSALSKRSRWFSSEANSPELIDKQLSIAGAATAGIGMVIVSVASPGSWEEKLPTTFVWVPITAGIGYAAPGIPLGFAAIGIFVGGTYMMGTVVGRALDRVKK